MKKISFYKLKTKNYKILIGASHTIEIIVYVKYFAKEICYDGKESLFNTCVNDVVSLWNTG